VNAVKQLKVWVSPVTEQIRPNALLELTTGFMKNQTDDLILLYQPTCSH